MIPSAIMLFLFSVLLPLTSLAAVIEGRVLGESGPLKDAKVQVYKSYADIVAGAPALASAVSDGQGQYKLELPEGEYYFIARAAADGGEFFSYHGSNPINVGNENIWLPLVANRLKMPVLTDGAASLKGTITYKGKPVKDAYISLYEPGDKSFKGLGFRTERIETGIFDVPVPPGKYVVVAKKMEGDNKIRPLKSGDLYCYYPRNPVEVKPGKVLNMELPCALKGEKTSKGNNLVTVDKLHDSRRAGIKGKITDREARPVHGVYMIAIMGDPFNNFVSYKDVQGKEHISRTDKNGEYFISLEKEGFYRLVARNQLGARTGENEFFMLFSGNARNGFDYKKGQVIDNVNMVIDRTGFEDAGATPAAGKKEGVSK